MKFVIEEFYCVDFELFDWVGVCYVWFFLCFVVVVVVYLRKCQFLLFVFELIFLVVLIIFNVFEVKLNIVLMISFQGFELVIRLIMKFSVDLMNMFVKNLDLYCILRDYVDCGLFCVLVLWVLCCVLICCCKVLRLDLDGLFRVLFL